MREIVEIVKKRELVFVKKLTISRTLAYIIKNDEPIKLIVRKKNNSVVTFLPIHHAFIYGPKEIELYGNKFKITIYPDCYMETKNPRTMTEFYILNLNNEWRELKKVKEPFESIFKQIWDEYNETLKTEKENYKNQIIENGTTVKEIFNPV